MTLGLLDLSIVTDRLLERLGAYEGASKIWTEDGTVRPTTFTINWTGLAPDVARKLDDESCQVSVFLFHVAADKFHRNTFPAGGGAQRIPEQPLALTLYYLLSAYSTTKSNAGYVEEQQAMSIALKCFHENPIVTATVFAGKREQELTLTLEPQTVDEIGRLWQALGSPMRLSAVYRVSVVFVEPPPPKPAKEVRFTPEIAPTPDSVAPGPIVASAQADAAGLAAITIAGARFGAGATVQIRSHPLEEAPPSPAPVASGQFRVEVGTDRLALRVPLYTPEGRYLLTVRPAAGRSTLEIWLDVPVVVSVVADTTGLATMAFAAARFDLRAPEVKIGAVTMVKTTDPPGPAEFCVVDKETLRLRVPGTPTHGQRYLVHVRPAPGKSALEIWLEVR